MPLPQGEGYASTIEEANKQRDRILEFHKDVDKIATPPEIDVGRRDRLVSVLQIAGKDRDVRGVRTPLLYDRRAAADAADAPSPRLEQAIASQRDAAARGAVLAAR